MRDRRESAARVEEMMDEWKFKKIERADVIELTKYFDLRPTKVCDSTLFDSYLWRDYYKVEFCIRDGRAVEWLMEEEGEPFAAMPLCTAEDLPYYFEDTRRYFHEVLGRKLTMFEVDEGSLAILQLDPAQYRIEEAVDSADYIYDAEGLRTLAGKTYRKKKNHVNAFLRDYEGRYEYRPLCCSDKQDIWRFLDRWEQNKDDDVENHLTAEVRGLHDVLSNCVPMDARMGGIFIDGELEAFSVGTYNEPMKMAIIHNEKANPDIRGLYPFINQLFLQKEFPEAELVNREDDLGLPGLRKAKLSYHPIEMARKFNIYEL